MAHALHLIWAALSMAAAMLWQMLWALILGFVLSAVVQALVSKKRMAELLPDDSIASLVKASALGAASSSCSYAAVALARSMVRKGANFNAAMVFQFASTNLVFELGILLVVLLGWPFAAAEFTGGLVMIAMLVVLLRLFLSPRLREEARRQADCGRQGRMEGHAGMDMSLDDSPKDGRKAALWQELISAEGRTAVSHVFVMELAAVWSDIVAGVLISGALAAWVPRHAWQAFFVAGHPQLALVVDPLIGPIVALLSFVCSVGNVPMAAVLWNGGISFGGVIAFLFADLIVLPILDIYRKYYGLRVAVLLAVLFYAAMASAALLIELLFSVLHLVPATHRAVIAGMSLKWNHTAWLNLGFSLLAVLLLVRFVTTGGPAMLRMMNSAQGEHEKSLDARKHASHRM
jgi:uncharacterized membrane protein YraQ (UPF0718 family)